MTRLYNLESYIECCQYARLFYKLPEHFIPEHGDLPRKYKEFIKYYANHSYLSKPISGSIRSEKLEINSGTLDYLSIGTELSQGDKQQLFIISDTVDLMTLSMSNLLEHRDGYLYSSAYHYWNHYLEICQHKIVKPLVFVDLDSFGCDRLIPVNFSRLDDSPYQVPILNTREPIFLDSGYNSIETYNSICQSTAHQILADNFPAESQNIHTVNHLASYLQKTFFFQSLQPYGNQKSFDYIIEILHNEQIFYKKVTLSIVAIAQIVSRAINTQYLRNLASKYPQYQFALVTQYNIFSNIQQLLPEFICLNPIFQHFTTIWQEKSQLNFPLFAIYLDQIEFAVGISDETGRVSKQWIQLSNQENTISYEGKPTVLIGRIPNQNRDFFRIPQGNQTANLPIKVNGSDYCKNGVPQDYRIEIENYQKTEDVCIRIEFHLQPGSFPELKVTDLEGKYNLTASLIDRKHITYSYIPPEKITTTRKQESLAQINRLQTCRELEQLKTCLLQISEELDRIANSGNKPINYTILRDLLQTTCQQINKNRDLLQLVNADSPDSIVSELRTEFQNRNIHKIVDIICRLLNSASALSFIHTDLLVKAIIFTGKTYEFSQDLLPDSLFQLQFSIVNQIKHHNLGNEYLQCLARVAVNEKLQSKYFNWFNSQYKLETSQYLWGYGRILLWYYNFESAEKYVKYRDNFTAILEYLVSKNYNEFKYQYKQNAFLSLLYLLTFRANDKVFCQHGSDEMRMAERVINHFKDDKIILKQVSQEKPLNNFFQEMIEGTATEDDVTSLLHG